MVLVSNKNRGSLSVKSSGLAKQAIKLAEARRLMDEKKVTITDLIGTPTKIGFLTLTIKGYEETPGDYLPNIWILSSKSATYHFTPYNGLVKI